VGATDSGFNLAERWNGSTWAIQPTPNPQRILDQLMGVSCTRPSSCIAVGWYVDPAHGDDFPLAMRWDGRTWKTLPTARPPGAQITILNGVSCSAANQCTAVGYYFPQAPLNGYATLVERWNGSVWSIQPSPNHETNFGDNYLQGVSCPSATACTAVGYANTGGGNGPSVSVAAQWNGSVWRLTPTPQPAGSATTKLSSVSCSSPAACLAVGTSASASLIEAWNGTAWSLRSNPVSAGSPSNGLLGVSCDSSGACTGVGFRNDVISMTRTLADRFTGTTASIESTPNITAFAPTALSGVACALPTACVSTGDYFGIFPVAEKWDGVAWRIRYPPKPRLNSGSLLSVACPSPTACEAVGYTINQYATAHPLIDRWDGTAWTVQAAPSPAGTNSRLLAVSCTSPTACTAVGIVGDATAEVGHPLAERWNGTRWSIQPTANPAGFAEFDGVSCSARAACEATGETGSPGHTVGLAEGWDGVAWAVQPTARVAGARTSVLAGLSCSSPAMCTAVGSFLSQAGTTATLAERWDGSTWTLLATPNPSGSSGAELSGLSCASSSACVAVGSSSGGAAALQTLAERWDGSAWSLQPTPNPTGAQRSVLSGVSCLSANACVAVGSFETAQGGTLTLVERLG
jgi:hypothetical protein